MVGQPATLSDNEQGEWDETSPQARVSNGKSIGCRNSPSKDGSDEFLSSGGFPTVRGEN